MAVNFGLLLKDYCSQNRIKADQLAKTLGYTTDAIYKIFKNPDIKIGSVLKISQSLRHDFFQYYQQQIANNIYHHASNLEAENKQLKDQLQSLRLESDIYKKLLKISDPEK